MFNDEQIRSYRNMKAPEALRAKVLSSARPRRIRVMPLIAALAACLILALSFGSLTDGGEAILINGQIPNGSTVLFQTVPASANRAASVYTFEVDLRLNSPAEVTVSSGIVSAGDIPAARSIRISGSTTLTWETECSESLPVCEMEIRDNDGVTVITLTCKNAEITANKRRINK